MYEPAFTAAGSGVGGAAGAVPGVLGRSPLLDLLKPLDYPRQALWNLVRGPARLAQGEGSLDDILGMVPGLAGAGMAALGPLGLLGGALAGGALQGLGKLTGSDAFQASTPQDVTGSEDFLPNLAVGAATDPLTYAGLGLGGRAGREIGKDLSVVPGGLEGFGPSGALGRLAEQPGTQALLGQAAEQLGPEQYGRLLQGAPGLGGGTGREGLEAAAQTGLASRNQALGEAVGQIAQQPRPQDFLDDVVSAGLIKDLGSQARTPLAPTPPRLSPEQAFEQLLPDFARFQKIEAAGANPRNALPGMLTDYPQNQLVRAANEPTRRLIGDWRDNPAGENAYLDPLHYQALPAAEAQGLRRWGAVRQARLRTSADLANKWGPLAAQLQKRGQLGPIEDRLGMNWAMLGDQINEGTLQHADILSGIERNLTEDEAFRMLFELGNAGMPGGPAVWSGQQEALNYLLHGLAEAHPGLAGEPASAIATSLSGAPEPGVARWGGYLPRSIPPTEFGGNPVTAEQIRHSLLADRLEEPLQLAAVRHGGLDPALQRALLDKTAQTPQSWWNPANSSAELPSALLPPGPAFPGEFSPGPAFPPLPGALAQASQNVARPLQPWEIQELERALAQRNPGPFQQRGLIP